MVENALTHWGVKGMKWGVRRYQNKDGSLTPAGKKRYDKEMAAVKAEQKTIRNKQSTANKMAKLEAEKKKLADMKEASSDNGKSSDKPKQKSVKELSDDELRKAVNRMQMEEQYNGLMARRFPPEQPGKLDRVKSYVSELGTKAVKDIAGKAVDKAVKDLFKEQEVDKATNYMKDLSKMGDKELARALKRATSENQIQKLIAEMDERKKSK